MKVNLPTVLVAVLIGLAATCVPAAAQTLKVDVPFPFTVEGKPAPAGTYEIAVQGPNDDVLLVRSTTAAKTEYLAPVVTRLGSLSETEAKAVFDKTAGGMVLSEVWIAGQDPYLVYATKGKHTHTTVKAKK